MTRHRSTPLVLLLVALTVLTGCHPTQPFYLHEDGDLSHFLDKATDLEYPDVHTASLEEVRQAHPPLTVEDAETAEKWDLTLEDVVSIALQNSKVIRSSLLTVQGTELRLPPFSTGPLQTGGLTGLGGGGFSSIYDTAFTDARVEQALAAFDAQLSVLGTQGGNGNFFSATDRPSQFGVGFTPIKQRNGGLRTELSKRTATGTQFFARNITDYRRGNTIFGGAQPVRSLWETTFELEVRQPLLQGRGALVNRAPILIQRVGTEISTLRFQGALMNFVRDVEAAYWNLYCAYRTVETTRIGRDSAQVTWNNVHEKKLGGIENAQAEAQAREQYYFFKFQLEQALRQLLDRENELRFLMGIAMADGKLIRPKDEPTAARVKFPWHEIKTELLVRNPTVLENKWNIKSTELELLQARNQLLPQLDVGATYRWYGVGDHLINADRNGLNFPAPGSTAFDELTEGKYEEAAFLLSLQLPIGYRAQLAEVRRQQLALARNKAFQEDLELQQTHFLGQAVRMLDYQYRTAQIQFNRWKASQDEVVAVTALWEGGKETLDLVLDAQRRRAEGQREYYLALCEYNKALAEVHFVKGSLLEHNNIYLSEGPWPEKAYYDALGRARERDASYYLDYGWTRPGVISQGPVHQHIGDVHDLPPGAVRLDDQPQAEAIPAPPGEPLEPEAEVEPLMPPSDPAESMPPLDAPTEDKLPPNGLTPPLTSRGGGDSDPALGAYHWGNLGLGESR